MKPDKLYSIAGITLEITGCLDKTLGSLKKYGLTGSFAKREAVLHIDCSVEEHIPALRLEPVYGVRHYIEEFGGFDGKYVSQDRDGDLSLATLTYDSDFHRVGCVLTDVEAMGGDSLASRMKVALGDCVVNCIPAFGGMTYHSSAISYDGQALLFAAPSGTGKSTQTRLWKELFPDKVEYINDDTPIIRKKDGVWYAFGSPWAGTSGINNNISAPVKAVIYVERGTENAVRTLASQEKFLRGLRSVRAQRFPVQAERQAKLLFDFLSSVPVYELRCDISRGAVESVKSILF